MANGFLGYLIKIEVYAMSSFYAKNSQLEVLRWFRIFFCLFTVFLQMLPGMLQLWLMESLFYFTR